MLISRYSNYCRLHLIAIVLLLSGCLTTTPNGPDAYFSTADKAIAEGKWNVASNLLEDWLLSPDQTYRSAAIVRYEKFPLVKKAFTDSFIETNLLEFLSRGDYSRQMSTINKRLSMYQVVATVDEYEIAKTNFDRADRGFDAYLNEKKRLALLQDERQLASELAETQRILSIRERLRKAADSAVVVCVDELQCRKAFAMAQIYINNEADMKIQLVSDTIVETYAPNDVYAIGMKVIKIPSKGTSSIITLQAVCKKPDSEKFEGRCTDKLINVYEGFPLFISKVQ